MRFDESYWSELIAKNDWYIQLNDFLDRARTELESDSREIDNLNKIARHFFEKALVENRVALAGSGPNLDAQRQAVDTIVIHHTSAKPGYRLTYLNAVHLLSIYLPYFVNPTVKGEESLKGSPLWSGHFHENRQVFWGYHWLMRMDGSFENLLPDSAIGWHAGNWQINRRSVGICLDNDFESFDPDKSLLRQLAAHIKYHYPRVKPENIIGHRECRTGTSCPGNTWLTSWKGKLVKYLRESD